MKDFIKNIFSTLIGLTIFVTVPFFLIFYLTLNSSTEQEEVDESILVLNLNMLITDKPSVSDSSEVIQRAISDEKKNTAHLYAVLNAIDKASKDDKIKGLLITGQYNNRSNIGWAGLQELKRYLVRFQESGKHILAYHSNMNEANYYLMSIADQILIHPLGFVELNGFSSEVLFFGEAFKKLGVEVQYARAGKYKSAVEPFTRTNMSNELEQQIEEILNDTFSIFLEEISKSRKISYELLDVMINQEGILNSENALVLKLVDEIIQPDELESVLLGKFQTKEKILINDYIRKSNPEKFNESNEQIALIYVEGEITIENDSNNASSALLVNYLDKARKDPDIKAVVVRVNSPGGSAMASEQIGRSIQRIRDKKPIIISMGAMAASGGYWLSVFGNQIFAEETTITGSIGAFSLFPNVGSLLNKLGVYSETVKTSEFADIYSISRSKNIQEVAKFQKMIDFIYQQFTTRVSQERNIKPHQLEKITGGRIWTGSRAMQLKLVDQIGGLQDAIQFAANQASLTHYRLKYYQKQEGFKDMIFELLEESNTRVKLDEKSIPDQLNQIFEKLIFPFQTMNDPNQIYTRLPFALTYQ